MLNNYTTEKKHTYLVRMLSYHGNIHSPIRRENLLRFHFESLLFSISLNNTYTVDEKPFKTLHSEFCSPRHDIYPVQCFYLFLTCISCTLSPRDTLRVTAVHSSLWIHSCLLNPTPLSFLAVLITHWWYWIHYLLQHLLPLRIMMKTPYHSR